MQNATTVPVTDDNNPDLRRRRTLVAAVSVGFGLGAIATSVPFIASLAPSARARVAGGPVEADIGDLAPGALKTIEWQQKPVWILKRTPEMLLRLQQHRSELRDPDSQTPQQPAYSRNDARSIKPELFVAVGLCTHLGCIPGFHSETGGTLGMNWDGGFYCPCHGSRFDLAGRVFKGVPAPTNLVVPLHRYLSDTTVIVGAVART